MHKPVTPTSGSLLLTPAELAADLRVSTRTIRRMDQTGCLPRPLRIGGRHRWDRATIKRWVAAGCPPRRHFEAEPEKKA